MLNHDPEIIAAEEANEEVPLLAYSNETNDPFTDTYMLIMAPFAAELNLMGDSILEQILENTDIPQAFVILMDEEEDADKSDL